ncbi:MAG: S41 family peptidase, partial [Saprospiraceae bacterium]
MSKFICFAIVSLAMYCTGLAQNTLLLRAPSINRDGSLISFSYQGDIWTVPSKGGRANRLTVHEAYESNPTFSPDGKEIAFSGNRFGNNDIFVMPTEGGIARRLTFHSAADNICSWTVQNQIIFSTKREFAQLERPSEIYSVSPKGGTEVRLTDFVAHDPILSPDGRYLAFVRGDINPVERKRYTGSSNRDIWIYDMKNKTYHKTPGFATNDISPTWGSNNQLYFLSSVDGEYNLYALKMDNNGKALNKPEKLTNFKDESIRAFNISGDGSTIVFEKDLNVYTMKISNKSVEKVSVVVNADERLDRDELKSFSSNASEIAISPNGKWMAFAIRGEIFVKETDKEVSRSVNVSNHPFRDKEPTWLNDTTLLFTSDRVGGNFNLFAVKSSDTSEVNIFKSLKHELKQLTNTPENVSNITVSNNGKKLAYVKGRGTFIVSDISPALALTSERVLHDGWNRPNDLSWSPDDQWIAYAQTDLYYNQEVFIQNIDHTSKPVNVSMHPRTDRSPYWSADGSKLGFISERSAGKSDDVWFVWLKKEDWEKESEDWVEAKNGGDDESDKPKGNKDKKTVAPVIIDIDKIHERIVQVTSLPGDERDLVISKDGKKFYYTTANSGAKGRDLYSIGWDGKDLKEITKGGTNPSNVIMDRDGKYLYYNRQGNIGRIDTKSNSTESLPFSAKMKIDYNSEKEQVFEEAWRTIKDGFYDPNFHGQDWNALRAKYKERCLGASTSNDFRDMFNLMLGELNSSHMGLSVADRVETSKESTGLLGAEVVPLKEGVKVKRIVSETPADKKASQLNVDDVILTVNGASVNENANFYELLNGLANEKVLLTVRDKNNAMRDVVIRLTNSISTNLYQQWVEDRRKLVDKYSNGRLGYIHIKGMDFASFEVVEREFTAAGYGKDGLIIDVRYNGGGSTTDYLMTILNYKQHAYTIPRGASNDLEKDKLKFRDYYPIGERLVYAAWTKPSIAMCNEGSYSNAEIFSHAYKSLAIGKLVGLPTNGSVISTGGQGLMDGSFVRLP